MLCICQYGPKATTIEVINAVHGDSGYKKAVKAQAGAPCSTHMILSGYLGSVS